MSMQVEICSIGFKFLCSQQNYTQQNLHALVDTKTRKEESERTKEFEKSH
jgi:hypothetical protein